MGAWLGPCPGARPHTVVSHMAVPNPRLSQEGNGFGRRAPLLGYHVRKRLLPHPSPAPLCPSFLLERRRGDYRGKTLNLGGINQHLERDGLHSLWLHQRKEMWLGFSAPCMQVHFGFLSFALIFVPVKVLYFCADT